MTLETNSFLFSEGKSFFFSWVEERDFCPSLKILLFSPLSTSSSSPMLSSTLSSSLLSLPPAGQNWNTVLQRQRWRHTSGSAIEPHKCVFKSTRTTKKVSFLATSSSFRFDATPVANTNTGTLIFVSWSEFLARLLLLSSLSLTFSLALSHFLSPFSSCFRKIIDFYFR